MTKKKEKIDLKEEMSKIIDTIDTSKDKAKKHKVVIEEPKGFADRFLNRFLPEKCSYWRINAKKPLKVTLYFFVDGVNVNMHMLSDDANKVIKEYKALVEGLKKDA